LSPEAHELETQHTLSTHVPVKQSDVREHAAPGPPAVTQVPALHLYPSAQSALTEHVDRHRPVVVSHLRLPVHVAAVTVGQEPLPVQYWAAREDVVVTHVAAPHSTVDGAA
jgi:hypothetical protein